VALSFLRIFNKVRTIKSNTMTTGAVIFWAITFTILIVIQIKVMINDKKA